MNQIRTLLMNHPLSTAFALGILSIAALPPYFCFPILLLTLSGLFYLMQNTQTAKSWFNLGYWFGFGFYAFGLAWIGNALLIDAKTFGWLYPIVLMACGGFFGLFIAFPACLSFYFKNIYARFLSFSALWVIFEWIRSFIFTGFPWNLLGTTLAFAPQTMQLASVIGTYGLSLLVLLTCLSPALWLCHKSRQNAVLSLSIISFLILLNLGYGFWRVNALGDSQESNIKIRLVQPSIPQTMKWSPVSLDENLNKYIALSREKGLEDIDFVIWGETASPFPLDYDNYYRELVTNAISEKGHLITGSLRYEADENDFYQPLNSMFIVNKHGVIEAHYDKSHLVPFGEYIPFREYLPKWVRPITNTIANFKAGKGLQNIQIADYPSLGALICYEIIFPAQVVNKNQKPQWLINLTNDGWYGNSAGPYQHLVSAQMRAVEEGITIVRAANTGISAVIDRLGTIRHALGLNQQGILDTYLPQELETATIYGKYRNIIPLILCFLNLAFAFLLKIKAK